MFVKGVGEKIDILSVKHSSFARVSIKGEGDMVGLGLLSARSLPFTSGLRVKSAMTGLGARPRRYLALLGMTRGGSHVMDSRLRGNDGIGTRGMTAAQHHPSGLRTKSAMT